ncbi:hypothetical protein ACIA8K_03565 [Catenuloplanes sp. NPDC051500]|uniref:hypothetical protein n=1 Tax=Catenuloplanes sp. NPDC051500 TaxID=3363959 RepID=UPI0037B2E392
MAAPPRVSRHLALCRPRRPPPCRRTTTPAACPCRSACRDSVPARCRAGPGSRRHGPGGSGHRQSSGTRPRRAQPPARGAGVTAPAARGTGRAAAHGPGGPGRRPGEPVLRPRRLGAPAGQRHTVPAGPAAGPRSRRHGRGGAGRWQGGGTRCAVLFRGRVGSAGPVGEQRVDRGVVTCCRGVTRGIRAADILRSNSGGRAFGNGREARKVFERTADMQASRLPVVAGVSTAEPALLTTAGFPAGVGGRA